VHSGYIGRGICIPIYMLYVFLYHSFYTVAVFYNLYIKNIDITEVPTILPMHLFIICQKVTERESGIG